MKKYFKYIILAVSLVLGAAFTLDLFLNTDATTGFLKNGSVFVHYILFAVFTVCIFFVSRYKGGKEKLVNLEFKLGFRILLAVCFVSSFFGGLCELFLFTMGKATVVTACIGAVMLVGSFWFLGLCVNKRSQTGFGLLFATGYVAVIVYQFLTANSSLYRIAPVVNVLAVMFSVLFIVYLLKTLEMPESGNATAIFFTATMAFFTGVCLFVPQQIWSVTNDNFILNIVLKIFYVVPIALVALYVMFNAKITVTTVVANSDKTTIDDKNSSQD